jgi:site-specific DNA-methyltransferase (adenine-specific)
MTPYYEHGGITIYHGDCRDVLPTLAPVGMVLTDPPYLPETEECFDMLAEHTFPLAGINTSLVTLCGHYHVHRVIAKLEHAGWRFWWLGGMRHTVYKRVPGKWVTAMWKPAVWCVKGGRVKGDTRTPFDLIAGKRRDKRFHEWGQPVNWFEHWMSNLSNEGDTVLDPFMGGGTTLVAARQIGRRAIGVDINEQHCETAANRLRLEEALPLEAVPA